MDRINCDGDYLLIAPKIGGPGYVHALSERAFLVQNILNFVNNFGVAYDSVTIYELHEVNESKSK